ncbi:MAG TPA: hypothetical protein EYN37_08845 [Dehalococcoidia bacterium]|nr:hypothetical protein [Dehalococcoidia bacterium]
MENNKSEIDIPTAALRLTAGEGDAFRFELADDKDRPRFRMVAMSGGVIPNHFYWKNFAIDLDGLRLGRQRKPALRDHDPQQIVGYTDSITKTPEGIVAEGVFTETTEAGREVLAMARDGFPWQASVYVPPESIEKVPADATAEVNGRTLEGPGHIFRKSWLREVTFTALGADEATDAVALHEDKSTVSAQVFTVASIEEEPMSEFVEPSELADDAAIEQVASEVEAVNDSTEAVTGERNRITAILSASLTGQEELTTQLIESGATLEEAQKALLSDVKGRMADRLSGLIASAPTPAGSEVEVEEAPASPEETWESEFNASPDLRSEFGESKFYIAYMRGVDNGSIRPTNGGI